jgi:hypothetical protein
MLAAVALGWAAQLGSLTGCSAAPSSTPASLPEGPEGVAVWRSARHELAALRRELAPPGAYRMNVTLDLEQRDLAMRMRARGAVAVRPPSALRMLLLGPGGTTALDLWVCGDRFRFAIPAVDLVRRGDAQTPPAELRGLPVDFLRWWFLRPLEGRLLSFTDRDDGRRYLVRDDAQVIHLTPRPQELVLRRVSQDDEEVLTSDRRECGRVRYRQRSTGIDIRVRCEERDAEVEIPARAFADPDDPSTPCEGGAR